MCVILFNITESIVVYFFRIYLAEYSHYWSKRATRITKGILIALGLLGTAYLISILVKRWLRQQQLQQLRESKRNKRQEDVEEIEKREYNGTALVS